MRHTRKEVVDRTKRQLARLDHVVSRLTPADWKCPVFRPAARDRWTVQDALAHILYLKEHALRVIRGGRRLPERAASTSRGAIASSTSVGDGARASSSRGIADHADVLETLAKTPSEFFGRRERSRERPLDFDGHSAAHRMKDIEAALRGAPAVRKRRTGA